MLTDWISDFRKFFSFLDIFTSKKWTSCQKEDEICEKVLLFQLSIKNSVTAIVKDYIYNESKGRVNYQTMIKISNTCQKFSVHWFLWDGSLSDVHLYVCRFCNQKFNQN